MYFMCFLQQNQKKYEQDLMFFSSRDMTEQCYSFQIITDPCVLYVFWSLYFRYYAVHVFYVFYVFFFQEKWQSNVAESRQSLTYVFCVFCVFFFYFILQILCRACVLRVLCVFFQETWQSIVEASRQSLRHLFNVRARQLRYRHPLARCKTVFQKNILRTNNSKWNGNSVE